MYTDMQWWEDIRRQVKVEGVSKREVLRKTGIHWKTLEKILSNSIPPGYQLKKAGNRPPIIPGENPGPKVTHNRDSTPTSWSRPILVESRLVYNFQLYWFNTTKERTFLNCGKRGHF